MGYLIPLLIFAAIGFAVYHFTKPKLNGAGGPGSSPAGIARLATKRKWGFIVLGAVVLLWLLSAVGVFGTAPATTVRPF